MRNLLIGAVISTLIIFLGWGIGTMAWFYPDLAKYTALSILWIGLSMFFAGVVGENKK